MANLPLQRESLRQKCKCIAPDLCRGSVMNFSVVWTWLYLRCNGREEKQWASNNLAGDHGAGVLIYGARDTLSARCAQNCSLPGCCLSGGRLLDIWQNLLYCTGVPGLVGALQGHFCFHPSKVYIQQSKNLSGHYIVLKIQQIGRSRIAVALRCIY